MREQFLEKMRSSYEYYYNMEQRDAGELPLVFTADFHARDEGYVLIKKAKIWAMESNEYVYVFSAPQFNKDTVSRCIDFALADGEPRIVPHKEHKDTYIIAVFVADDIEPAALDEIKRRKFDKSYKFGLEGFAALKTAAITLERECITTNRVGSSLRKFFKKLLRSEKV